MLVLISGHIRAMPQTGENVSFWLYFDVKSVT